MHVVMALLGYHILDNRIGFVGAGCRDIDDALHCTLLPGGHFEVGVRKLYLIHKFDEYSLVLLPVKYFNSRTFHIVQTQLPAFHPYFSMPP